LNRSCRLSRRLGYDRRQLSLLASHYWTQKNTGLQAPSTTRRSIALVSHCWTKANADLLIPDATRTGIALVSHCWTKGLTQLQTQDATRTDSQSSSAIAGQRKTPVLRTQEPQKPAGSPSSASAGQRKCAGPWDLGNQERQHPSLVSHCWTRKDAGLHNSQPSSAIARLRHVLKPQIPQD
jgi:hypothetical protein